MSVKEYRCTECGGISLQETNHWGKIYPECRKCGHWPAVMECMESPPDGVGLPPDWDIVSLGDVADILYIASLKIPATEEDADV